VTAGFDAFAARARQGGGMVPVTREVVLDGDTPVTAFAKLHRGSYGFLLESLEGGERWARYTFLATEPREVFRYRGRECARWTAEGGWTVVDRDIAPLEHLGRTMRRHAPVEVPGLPRFTGGAVGYLGYDVVRTIEHLPDAPPDDRGLPDAIVMVADTLLVLDNLYNRATVIATVEVPGAGGRTGGRADGRTDPEWGGGTAAPGRSEAGTRGRTGAEAHGGTGAGTQGGQGGGTEESGSARDDAELRQLYQEAEDRIDRWLERLAAPGTMGPLRLETAPVLPPMRSPYPDTGFTADVARIKEYIAAGDTFQTVLSRRIDLDAPDPFLAYRYLRALNPAPYLYFLHCDDIHVLGSSPEILVRVEEGEVTLRPIAGTRPRGADADRDAALAAELAADPKERAEHLMLVDLGRNDVGRVAEFGSVRLTAFMTIERYSHVMHLVSEVRGRLRPELDAVAALVACFPAGTVSGAPKVRAMQIIDELEPTRRGPYAGAVGYVGWGARTLDTAIAIRTCVIRGGRAWVQAGAGIVADSDPEAEWRETEAKARAVVIALALARAGGG
jgi:anthranilate synthase component 1